ncbi:hypothetical protein [Haloferula sp.]|uniref:hypothetical protein n=1 Tax=Haloferula sp. TaxID=2497595 RepID=UPI003C729DD9
MKLLKVLSLSLVVLSSAYGEPATTGEKSYQLVSEKPEVMPGLKLTVTESMTMEGGKFTMEMPEGPMEGALDQESLKVVSVAHETASKIKATITSSKAEQTMSMNGQAMPQPPQEMPLIDVPLAITLTEGTWKAQREDGEEADMLAQVELANIERLVSGVEDENVYGTEPRKPGDTWTVDAREMSMVDASDDVEGSVKMKFDQVAEHEGIECAFLTGEITMNGSPPGADEAGGGKIELSGTFKIIRSLEHRMDLSRTMNGNMKIEMKTPIGMMKMAGPVVMKKTVEIVD